MMRLEKKTIDLFTAIFDVLKPLPPLTLSQWADLYVRLPAEGGNEQGRWRTDRAPYQREIMNAITDDRVQEIVAMCGAQVGKTAIILNAIGYCMHYAPGPLMVMEPTIAMAQAFSKDRLSPMIRDTPILSARVNEKRAGGNTILQKKFPGGYVTIIGANSPNSLRMRPIQRLFADEVDSFPASAGKEGDPLYLADRRTDTFWNKKKVRLSTPTIKGISRIEVEYERSTQEEWNVPCPQCGELQPLCWAQIVFDKEDRDGEGHIRHVGHVCARCGAVSSESAWKQSQLRGKYIAKYPERAVRGFHLNALVSPWKPWREIVEEFLTANEERKKGNIELLKVWVNTVLGEVWEDEGQDIDADALLTHCTPYTCEVPSGVLVLTAGVDVQDNRLEAEVVGWGAGKESWGIRYTVFMGSPGQTEVWEQLDAFLQKPFIRADGAELKIACACVDSGGHFTTEVYRFCKGKELRRVFPIKGRGGSGVPYINRPTNSNRMKVSLFTVGVDTGKELLLERLRLTEEGGGYCHFPAEIEAGYDRRYFEGITAEKRVMRYNRGRPRFEWVLKKSGIRNEPLDLRVYATAALEIYNPVLEPGGGTAPPRSRRRGVVNRGL